MRLPDDDDELRALYLAACEAGDDVLADGFGREIERRAAAEPKKPTPALARVAAWYARNGIAVFPLVRRGKLPAISKKAGGRGFLDATVDLDQIRAWWSKWPHANIGAPTGLTFDVVDLDGAPGVQAFYGAGSDDLRASFPPIIGRVQTARPGGWHLYLEPQGLPSGAAFAPGIDYRGREPDGSGGGYVVLPPSEVLVDHRGPWYGQVRRYRWVDPLPVPRATRSSS